MKVIRLSVRVIVVLIALIILTSFWFFPASQRPADLPVAAPPTPLLADGHPAPKDDAFATFPGTQKRQSSPIDVHALSTNLNAGFQQEISRAAYHEQWGPGVTPAQWKRIGEFLTLVSDVSHALSKDDFAASAAIVKQLEVGLPLLRRQLGRSHSWAPLLGNIVIPPTWSSATNLTQARADFRHFSHSLVEWVRAMRRSIPQLAPLRVYRCSFDSTEAYWFQLGPPLRNPYYGPSRLDYGVEAAN